MPYRRLPGLPGWHWVPAAADPAAKRHPCPDCLICQQCAESRCRACRRDRAAGDAGAEKDAEDKPPPDSGCDRSAEGL